MKEVIEFEPVEAQEITPALDFGALAIGNGFVLVEVEKESPLNDFQYDVISMTSVGHTSLQAGKHLHVHKKTIERAKREVIEVFETPNMAAAIHVAIQRGVLPVPLVPDETIVQNISPTDRRFIKLFAQGISCGTIAESLKIANVRVITSYEKDIFRKLRASNIAHAIRRAHELGLLS